MTTRSILVASPREAHRAVSELFQQEIKPHTSKGAAGRLIWQTVNDYHRHQLRKLFHGPVLRDIAFQIWVPDPYTGCRVRYVPLVWKRHFAELFIEPDFEEYTTRDGEIKVREKRRSTESLSDDDFAEFLLQVLAYAVIEWSVVFTEHDHEQ
ncbi:hypothetical protein J7E62_27585 [Variovorax paradoxus]|nr:hypothetical protein [Variovorax paradoxus]